MPGTRHRRRLDGLLIVVVSVTGCSDPTGPDDSGTLRGTWSLRADVKHWISPSQWYCAIEGTMSITSQSGVKDAAGKVLWDAIEGTIERRSICSHPDMYEIQYPASVRVTGTIRGVSITIEEEKRPDLVKCTFTGVFNGQNRERVSGSVSCSHVTSIISGVFYEGAWQLTR